MSEQEEPTTAGPPGLAGAVGRVVNRVAERRWGEVETAAGGGAGGAGGVDWARVGAEMDAEMHAGTGSEGAGFLFLPMHLDLIVRCEALVGGGYGFWCPLWTSRGPSRLGVGGVAHRGPIVSARRTTTPGSGPGPAGPAVPDSGPGPPASAVPTTAVVPAGPGVAAAPPAGGVFRAGSWSRCG